MDPLALTAQLNALLQAIHLPFALESPADLTPSLLIAILESILNVRIPVAHVEDGDDDRDVLDGHLTPTKSRHIQTVKIFLGVLETDILQIDVGLSKLDPRLLAAGAWDEVVYVAEVLCWIGEEVGLIGPTPVDDKAKAQAQETPYDYARQDSSLARSSATKAPTPSPSSTITFLPPFTETSPPPTPTTTTLLFATDADNTFQTNDTSLLTTSSPLRQLPNSSTGLAYHHPRDPHINSESESSSVPILQDPMAHRTHGPPWSDSPPSPTPLRDIPPDDSSFTRQTPPIRRTGYISLVDHDAELSSFFARSLSVSNSSRRPLLSAPSPTPTPQRSRPKPQLYLHPRAIPTTPTRRRRSEYERDWRTLLSTSPDRDPRRTYDLLQQRMELMEELLRIRVNQQQPLQ